MNSAGGMLAMATVTTDPTAGAGDLFSGGVLGTAHAKFGRDNLPEFASSLLANVAQVTTLRTSSTAHSTATTNPAVQRNSARRKEERPPIAGDLLNADLHGSRQGSTGEISEAVVPETGPISASGQGTTAGAEALPHLAEPAGDSLPTLTAGRRGLTADDRQMVQAKALFVSLGPDPARAKPAALPLSFSPVALTRPRKEEPKPLPSADLAPLVASAAPLAHPVLVPALAAPHLGSMSVLANEVAVLGTPESSSLQTTGPDEGPKVMKGARATLPADAATSQDELAQPFDAGGSAKPVEGEAQLGLEPVQSDLGVSVGEIPGAGNPGVEFVDKTATVETRPANQQAETAALHPVGDSTTSPEMAASLMANASPSSTPGNVIGPPSPSTSPMPGIGRSQPRSAASPQSVASPPGSFETIMAGASLGPHPGAATQVEIRAGDSGEGHGLPPEDVLTRMDSGGTATDLRPTEHSVAIGIDDPAHGWIEVRAQGVAGQVTASLNAASSDAHAALHAQLPAMAQYLAEHDLGVRSLAVSGGGNAPGHAGGGFSDGGFGGASGGQGGSQSSPGSTGDSNRGPNSAADRRPSLGVGEAAGWIAGEPSPAAIGESLLGGGRLLSVRA